ncbi:hypothetical protein G4Y79_14225 [Phototrophicus methaneseepsis]|uniref:Penicillin-binding protein transpeptidase domain-containing protein n=1 Tax=Phototrophicus methaneseepsis TaxID=2710758 RepID=A0A7S8ID06_9CHLR|nr:penicillin-binding transpeptidase domain-containing protein [Phototrophicus methaneseepsis]QPC80864.1 hypothetical protein G4Y79_14225 [Phototrophicus methaneseepsis]
MPFAREIHRTMIVLLVAFFLVALAAAYWGIVGPDTILNREDNPRVVEAESAILRGRLYDRNDALLAESASDEDGIAQRRYLYDAMHSALGYYSLRYGVNGVESAYDALLKGDTLPAGWDHLLQQDFLHRPVVGSDLRLTFDLDIQQAAVNAMQDQVGAAVVLGISKGDVLALVSLPTYDPNTLDETWADLIEAPNDPFFNRVLQGSYQPGNTLNTPLLAAASLAGIDMNTKISNATRSVQIDDLTLTCVQIPPTTSLTLVENYAYGCPAPFVDLAEQLGEETVNNYLDRVGNRQLPSYLGFSDPIATPEATSTPIDTTALDLVEEATGQGMRSVTPITLASMVSAIALEGNAPQPYTILSSRAPGGTWVDVATPGTNLPFFTDTSASALKRIMQNTLQITGRPSLSLPQGTEVGGQIALAYSGEETQAWFIGFVRTSSGHGAAVVIVLEQADGTEVIDNIAQEVLLATYEALVAQEASSTQTSPTIAPTASR